MRRKIKVGVAFASSKTKRLKNKSLRKLSENFLKFISSERMPYTQYLNTGVAFASSFEKHCQMKYNKKENDKFLHKRDSKN